MAASTGLIAHSHFALSLDFITPFHTPVMVGARPPCPQDAWRRSTSQAQPQAWGFGQPTGIILPFVGIGLGLCLARRRWEGSRPLCLGGRAQRASQSAAGGGARSASKQTLMRTPLGLVPTKFSSVLKEQRVFASTGTCTEEVFATGGTRVVYRGVMADGVEVVVKKFATEHPMNAEFWTSDIDGVAIAQQMAAAWNQLAIASKPIVFLEPVVYYKSEDQRSSRAMPVGERVLIEPYVPGEFKKYNSNSGWVCDAADGGDMLQAFSHWTYHKSGGTQLVCDIQGIRCQECYILTDPVINSATGECGVCDLGVDGMNGFFYHHECNRFCNPQWKRIVNPQKPICFAATSHTTFGPGRA